MSDCDCVLLAPASSVAYLVDLVLAAELDGVGVIHALERPLGCLRVLVDRQQLLAAQVNGALVPTHSHMLMLMLMVLAWSVYFAWLLCVIILLCTYVSTMSDSMESSRSSKVMNGRSASRCVYSVR